MEKISAFYINLDSATDRKKHIDDMWSKKNIKLPIERFSAIKPEFTLGQLSVGETGCLLSHLKLWEDNTNSDRDILILEDDAIVCNEFDIYISNLLSSQTGDWDILFLTHTEPINDIQRIQTLLKFSNATHHHKSANKLTIINANEWYLYGTVGYILNHNSTSKLLTAITKLIEDNNISPIDILINSLARQGAINCKLVFPYLVGVRTDLESQILRDKNKNNDQLHEVMINLFFIDRDNVSLEEWANKIYNNEKTSLEQKVISQIYSTYLSRNI